MKFEEVRKRIEEQERIWNELKARAEKDPRRRYFWQIIKQGIVVTFYSFELHVEGKTYAHKEFLKSKSFTWDRGFRAWIKKYKNLREQLNEIQEIVNYFKKQGIKVFFRVSWQDVVRMIKQGIVKIENVRTWDYEFYTFEM